MDEPNVKKPNLKFSTLLIVVALGVVTAAVLYQAQTKGLLPKPNLEAPKITSQETRTIIQEENAVISTVD